MNLTEKLFWKCEKLTDLDKKKLLRKLKLKSELARETRSGISTEDFKTINILNYLLNNTIIIN